jgi:four helix bundle protein
VREEINKRFFIWVNSVLDHLDKLGDKTTLNIIKYQLSKSSLSSVSNYRVSIRAKSVRDMINKLKITEEELDESIGWLEILQFRTGIDLKNEMNEANELLAIVVSSIISLKKKI